MASLVGVLKFREVYNALFRKGNFLSARYQSSFLNGKTLRIGCASGFWGDTATSVPQLVMLGQLDFLVFDYLSEITMSLLVAMRRKYPDLGYTPDFIMAAMMPHLAEIKRQGIRVISNAGGINPHACAKALKEAASKQDINLHIAVVTGDDLIPQKEEIEKAGYKDMTSGLPFPKTINSMNAYLGAGPISAALDMGADVVITGRCTDSALALAPLLHTFKWKLNDWNKLAAGSLAGHLIECGAQSTGGIFTDWQQVPEWDNIGFPIVECAEDGKFVITKPESTGGLVSIATVSEQLVYEIGDPKNYILPDVTCDFSEVKLTEVAENSVLVEGAKGKPAPDHYKVSATFEDGYRAIAVCPIKGGRAVDKAQKTAVALLKRCNRIFDFLQLGEFKKTHLEILGSEKQSYGDKAMSPDQVPREVVMWVGVQHDKKLALDLFAREIASAGTGAAPGLTNLVGGRPKVAPLLRLFSFLYPKVKLKIEISLNDESRSYEIPPSSVSSSLDETEKVKESGKTLGKGSHTYRLEDLAFTRSGDKGDTANIGVIARHPAYLPYLEQALTEKTVGHYFKHFFEDSNAPETHVKRYKLPGINALNFLLNGALGGGGVASLRSDPQGKALGQQLLDFEIENMPDIKELKKL